MVWPFSRKQASIPHPGSGPVLRFLHNIGIGQGGAKFDYSRRVGTGISASVVMAPIQWVQRSMPEAPLIIEKRTAANEWEQIEHDLTSLIETPNKFYSGIHLWQATVFSYLTDGNAYWIILRNSVGRPVELWYTPHWLIRPGFPSDGSDFVSHYVYTVGGKQFMLEIKDVIHFRHGINPQNLRLGISPLNSAIMEIWTDMEAGEFIATLLRNEGIPGLILSPDTKEGVTLQDTDKQEIKDYIVQKTTGSHRGEPVVMSAKTKIERLAWNPQEMDLTAATDRSEERVCALLGIPAAVVGFSAGLETTKVGATMAEMRKLAWQNGVIPLQGNFASEINRALLPQFGRDNRIRSRFDVSDIEALQEDVNKRAERIDRGVKTGWISVASAKRAIGMEPEKGDEVYLRGFAIVAVPVGQVAPPPPDMGTRALAALERKDTGFERRIADTAPRAPATDAQQVFMAHQEAAAPILSPLMEKELIDFFDMLGKRAAEVGEPILAETFKASGEDMIMVERIFEAMNMLEIVPIFEEVYEKQYLRVLTESTAEAFDIIGLQTDVPDPVARAVVATGGRRAGLVDLKSQTKRSLFVAIEEGRSLGEGADALAKRIAQVVERGPWSTVEIRSRVIARTETKHAQRVSVLHMAKGQGVQQFRVFDGRLGLTDATCTSLDGAIVSADVADQLATNEHPNGTRDFVPFFGEN